MRPKKGRRVRKIEIPSDSVPECELGNTVADIQWRREEKEAIEREGGGKSGGNSHKRSDIKTEAVGREVGPSQSQYKKGHMTNIYMMDSVKEALVNFVKNHKGLYDNTNEHFKDKARKEYIGEQFTNSNKPSVKVCKTWFELQRTQCGKLTQSKSGQAPKQMMECQSWIQDKNGFRRSHIRCKGLKANCQASSPRPEEPVLQLLWQTTSPELRLTQTV